MPKHDAVPLDGHSLSLEQISAIAAGQTVQPAADGLAMMEKSRAVVQRHLDEGQAVYGLTTGLGSRVTHQLAPDVLAEFSRLTIFGRSHAVGAALEDDVLRATMAIRLNGLLTGGSGAAPAVAESLVNLLNHNLHPVVPGQGSIGAGDLCVLAGLGLVMIGEGEIRRDGRRQAARTALENDGLEPLTLGPKDALAICNSSAYSAALAALALIAARRALAAAQISAALTMEGFRANLSPLDPRAVAARPVPGQERTAAELRALLASSSLNDPTQVRRVQDPISIRCVAQIHGAMASTLDFVDSNLDPEINGMADNPVVLVEDGEILSNGNFQTTGLALSLECASQALSRLSGAAVSRIGTLLQSHLSGLPANLSPHDKSRSGFAPVMKVALSLQQEIAQKALPALPDLRWTAEGVEDDLTNTPLAAQKLRDQTENLWRILAIELMVATQAVEVASAKPLGTGTQRAYDLVREQVKPLQEDRPLGGEIEALASGLLSNGQLVAELKLTLAG